MDGKQLVRMGTKIGNTYAACMEQHILSLFVAITSYLGNLIDDGDVVNAYAHAPSQGITIYIAVDEVFQAWYLAHLNIDLSLGTCVPLLKAMQGHPSAGTWWSEHFDATCAASLHLVPTFTEPTLYRRDDSEVQGPTFMLRQVDDILVSVASSNDRMAVLTGIASTVTFTISPGLTSLFYATDIEQTALYIKVYAKSYIQSCLLKLGWDTSSKTSAIAVPMTPTTLKEMAKNPGPLDPGKLATALQQFGFPYRTLTGMLIFAVQIGRFDIGPTVSVLCKFNDRPGPVHFMAAKNVMRYLRSTILRGNVYWRPTGKERPDLPRGDITPYRPEANIDALYPRDFPLLEPVCFVDASYGGLLIIGEPRSISGIVIMLGGTAIFAKTRTTHHFPLYDRVRDNCRL
jgi:hypothetical protein